MKVNPVKAAPFSGALKIQSNWNLGTNLISAQNIKRIDADSDTDSVKIVYNNPDTDEYNSAKIKNTDPTLVLAAYTAALLAPADTIIDISA